MTTILTPPPATGPESTHPIPGGAGLDPAGPPPSRWYLRWWRPAGRPSWSGPARAAVFLLTAVLYTWDLARIGLGNTFYAAAVKSGTESWKAFFFGSLDPGSFITVDKPPASLWVMELSGRIFGFSSLSMLLPEALAGLASVMVLYHVVRRWQGEVAAVLASLALALTPVAVVIFRYNDPDAFLVLLLVLAGWALWSALETARTSRLVLSGALIGLAFLTKTLDAFIVLPAFALVYLWCGPPRLRRRLGQLAWAGLAVVVSSGWWVAIVELWPASARPYIGGSTDNSEWNLIFGYNGFARLFGSGGAAGGGGSSGSATTFGGGEGIFRMFNDALGGQIAWLLPLGLAGLVGGLWLTRRQGRASLSRAGYVLFGGWLLMFMAVYDDAKGIFHPYYTVVLAPAVAALAGGGAVGLWRLGQRSRWWAPVLPAAIVGTAVWADVLLGRSVDYYPWLGTTVVVTASLASLVLLLVQLKVVRLRALGIVAGVLAAASLLAGPSAYALTTVNSTTTGVASAGPSTAGQGGAGGPGGGFGAGASGGGPPGASGSAARAAGAALSGRPTGAPPSGSGSAPTSGATRAGTAPGPGGGAGGGMGGGQSVATGLLTYLERHQGSAKYLVAVEGSQTAAPYILESGKPVIAMGGFTGSDPTPTLAQFKALVAAGEVRYVYVGGSGGGGGMGGGAGTSAVLQWVEQHGTKVAASSYGSTSSGGTLYLVTPSSVTS